MIDDKIKYYGGPECCGQEMVEVSSKFMNVLGEYEVVGFRCLYCHREEDLTGNELEDQLHITRRA